MSAQLRRCRRGLSEALGQATNHLPEVDYCSATMSGLEPTLYVSCPLPIHYPEMLHTFPLFLAAHNHALTQHRADCGQGSRHGREGFTVSGPEPEPQDLPTRIEFPSLQTLEELMAKLEFENELNQVCNRPSLYVNTPPARRDSAGSADSTVEEGAADEESDEEDVKLIGMILDMEQDYELFVY